MGDIQGRPKTPSQQVVYVPQYTYANTEQAGSTPGDTKTSEEKQTEQREKSLLGRSRSRLGTILTGFRGILSPSETDASRKTLLGE